ncbi:MAG: phosphoribosylglycinamide formyltransferase [Candidatus Eisenbacteria bacterium]|nr:phosphoribosylglycinamide formyltransferase [Candidatus Latescibacterota bacterium]MBD3301607.1 phosphoribosylglycinamide formyltransferase [Candidatus Eisenbacteria bacterium]
MRTASVPRPDQLPQEPRRLALAVLISGSGSTMANLADRISEGSLDARIRIVISSRRKAAGIEKAHARGLATEILPRRRFVEGDRFDADRYTAALLDLLEPRAVDLVVLGGFMSRLGPALFERYPVVNVHPALLPRFGGQGMYGHHVHEAVLGAGETRSGCTVHFVDPEYDHGPILAQREVEVRSDDTSDTLAARVQAAERELYPEAIGRIAAGKVRVDPEGRVTVLP